MSNLYFRSSPSQSPSQSLTVPGPDSFTWFLLQSTYWVKPPALASISGPFYNFSACPNFLLLKCISLYLISVSASLSHLAVILTGPALTCAGSGFTVHYGPSQHWSFHKDRQSEEQSRPWRARKTDVQCRPKRMLSVCGGDGSELVQRDEPTFTQPSLLYFNKVLLNTYYGPMPFQVLGT